MTSTRHTFRISYMIVVMLAAVPSVVAGQHGADSGEWRSYAADAGSTKYSPLRPGTQCFRRCW